MNTTRLKSFAAEARNILKRGVMNRILALGFDQQGHVVEEPVSIEGGAVFMGETQSEDFYTKWVNLRERIEAKGLREVQEEAAYTWFNRLMAIRIMQMNHLIDPVLDYRSESVRLPILLTDAMRGAIPAMPEADRERLMRLLNDPRRTAEQFAMLITAYCHNTPVINRCFGSIADYTELLLPRDILEENNFIDMMNHTDFISDEDYKTPELIGWLYQFYISERKDEVFAKKGKYDPDEIPAATQIFTPNWIVKYMVQNTVGRIYVDANPCDESLIKRWKYFVEPNIVHQPPVSVRVLRCTLEEIKVADLACGSGHILNECFNVLLQLYVMEGYSQRQAIKSILKNNLIGIDLDTRAKQLASFSLLLKACQKDASFVDAKTMPNVLDMPRVNRYTWRDLHGHMMCALQIDWPGEKVDNEIDECFALMEQADSLGSIMKFDISPETREFIKTCIREQNQQHQYEESFADLFHGFELILALTERYHAIVMNPPYMGSGSMGNVLSKYIKDNYEEGKADLFSTFMMLAIDRLVENGKYGMINMHSWMFLSSFEKLRKTVLEEQTIDSLLHLGPRTFDELGGEVVQNSAFVITKGEPTYVGHFSDPDRPEIPSCQAICSRTATYFRLVDGRDCGDKERMLLNAISNHTEKIFYTNIAQSKFEKIPGSPIGYWLPKKFEEALSKPNLGEIAHPRRTIQCGDVSRFIRFWHEISYHDIELTNHIELLKSSNKKWFKFSNGGNSRRWFGNLDSVLFWGNNGFVVKSTGKAIIPNEELYFKESIGYNRITSNGICARFFQQGILLGDATSIIVTSNNAKYLLALLNSKVSAYSMAVFNPTLAAQTGSLSKVPVIIENNNECERIASNSIAISRKDWDAHEFSWDFKGNELVDMTIDKYLEVMQVYGNWIGAQIDLAPPELDSLEWRVGVFHTKWETLFERLHANEEELNRQFIDIYGLQDELTPDVPLDEVTILQQGEISIEDGKLVWHDDVIIKQLISYAVGCWMGRYRLDKPGLHIAHTDATPEEMAPYDYNGEPFEIDDDGIIPLMPKDCMFPDNAALRIADFVRQVFGSDTQVANLNYIEQALGKSLEQYFIKDFWKDHKKMYQNRPIYWLFSSKKGAFQCLAYMHRMDAYTVERVRQKYLLPHMDDLRKRIADMEQRAADLNSTERRTLDSLQKQLAECLEYHDRLHPVADRQIAIDLDDGVVVNHAKFGDILAKLK